ncbi:MAG: ABC transporter ATP-binding protein [Candidatus Desulfofervidus auxilii]|nr:ABC transporter ATP-binding protein [Candidatus Desulfofervidus auxilii]
MSIIQVEHLTKEFKKRQHFKIQNLKAVDNISFSVEKEVFGFIGPNGAGKSTTIKLIMGLLKPTSGTISVFGQSVDNVFIKKKIGFLPENPYIYTNLTAYEFLHFCGNAYGFSEKEINKKIDYLLELVDLKPYKKSIISSFSKGMIQRLLIAHTLINDPKLIILDEPMSGLDPLGRNMVSEVIERLKEEGKTVFYSSHILHDVEKFSDRVAVIVKGKIKLMDRVENIVSSFISEYVIIYRKPGSEGVNTTKIKKEKLWEKLDSLKKEKFEIIQVEPYRVSLEDIFVKLAE